MMTRSSRRRQRGAAYAETVVMLPFFAAVWAGMIYMHKAYSAKVYTMAETRTCVWTYATNGCQRLPPGCSITRGEAPQGDRPSALDGLQRVLGSIGNILQITNPIASTRVTRSVAKPGLLGGGSITVLAGQEMMCNTVPATSDSIVQQAFCAFTPFC
jgi:hypothetical protein